MLQRTRQKMKAPWWGGDFTVSLLEPYAPMNPCPSAFAIPSEIEKRQSNVFGVVFDVRAVLPRARCRPCALKVYPSAKHSLQPCALFPPLSQSLSVPVSVALHLPLTPSPSLSFYLSLSLSLCVCVFFGSAGFVCVGGCVDAWQASHDRQHTAVGQQRVLASRPGPRQGSGVLSASTAADASLAPVVKLGDASIASPFTSSSGSLQAILHIIRHTRPSPPLTITALVV